MGTHKYIPLILLPFLSLFWLSCNSTDSGWPAEDCLIETGIASWYGSDFHGGLTANGERYDMESLTAAHKTLPFNTIVRVVNTDNDREVTVRINNRGPFITGRVIDLSKKAAREIDIITKGLAEVELYLVKEGDAPAEDIRCRP